MYYLVCYVFSIACMILLLLNPYTLRIVLASLVCIYELVFNPSSPGVLFREPDYPIINSCDAGLKS